MLAHYSKQLSHVFVIDELQLKKLTKLLQDRFDKVSFNVDCVDGSSYDFETVEDLIAHENPKSKKIYRISLYAQPDNDSTFCRIVFDDVEISIDFTVNADAISRLRDDLHNIIEGTRPWYYVIPRSSRFYGFSFGFLMGGIGVLYFKDRLGILGNFEGGEKHLVFLALCLCMLYIGFFVLQLIRQCFPQAVFLIGQEKSRFKHLRWIQGIIIIPSIIALIFFLIELIIY